MNKSTQLILCFTVFFSFVDQPLAAQAKKNINPDILFKENKGQVSDQHYKSRPDILFSGQTGPLNFYLKTGGIAYQLNRVNSWKRQEVLTISKSEHEQLVPNQTTSYRVDINWLNVLTPEIKKGDAQPGYDNYYLATCPEGALHVQSYADVLYKNLYAGIDLKWYQKDGQLKYDYYVAAFSDYKQIKLEYKGAEKISVNANGDLIVETPLGNLIEQKPMVFQNGKTLEASWHLEKNIISFVIKNVDSSEPLTIDPLVRLWGTYFGGPGEDYCSYTTTDYLSNVIVSGRTKSFANIATTGAHQTSFGGVAGADACVVKFDQNGLRLWSTYYGGTKDDYALNCKANSVGEIYMVGGTASSNTAVFASAAAHQATCSLAPSNIYDAFLVKFDASGARLWSTFYGGDGADYPAEIGLDNSGNIYLPGQTASNSEIATNGSHQPTLGSSIDAFLVKFNASGVRQWGTYFGGNGNVDQGTVATADPSGNIYLSGVTSSTNAIVTTGSHQSVLGGGTDGFLAKFTSSGSLSWATYYGGSGTENLFGYVTDASGNIFCTGATAGASGTVIATAGSHQSTYGGGTLDCFIVKFDGTGQRIFGTYYGGTGEEIAGVAAFDLSGNLCIVGSTSSNTGTAIATPCSYQPVYGGGSHDLYMAKFTPTGTRLWGTYYGGPYTDFDQYCSVDGHGNIYLSGTTLAGSTVVVTSGAYQGTYGGGPADGLIVKFNGCIPGNAIDMTSASNLLVCPGNTTTLNATCGNWYSSATDTNSLATGSTFTTGIINSDTTFYVEDFSCGSIFGPRTAISLTLIPSPTITITNSNPAACIQEFVTLTASGASTYSWMNTSSASSTHTFFTLLNTTFTVSGTAANGCQSTATIAVFPVFCLGTDKLSYLNGQLNIFPNPGAIVTVNATTELHLILINQLGQAIRSLRLSFENGYEIVLPDLSDGIYFLKDAEDGAMLNKKIVIMR